MSKPVRIRGDVAARVEERAASETRSFANMVEVLLLAALTERGNSGDKHRSRADGSGASPGSDRGDPVTGPRSVSADVAATVPGVQLLRPHMRKDRPAVECSERVPAGSTCGVCGRAVGQPGLAS